MQIFLVCVLLFVASVSAAENATENAITNSVAKDNSAISAQKSGHYIQYAIRTVEETFGKIDWRSIGLSNATLPTGELIDDYVAPHNIPQRFVYYHAGVDYEDRPLWIGEWGKWDIKGLFADGHLREFAFYFIQLTHRAVKSIFDNGEQEASAILDFADLSLEQITHIPTATFLLGGARMYRDIIHKHLGEGIIINANFATESLINLVKPTLGAVYDRLSVYGNNRATWVPKLLRKIPRSSLPEWYGGEKGFTPIKVYG